MLHFPVGVTKMLDSAMFYCEVCGQTSVIDVDPMGGYEQDYVEECEVCCKPHHIHVFVDPSTLELEVSAHYEH